mgnify:CR=1 FL=1
MPCCAVHTVIVQPQLEALRKGFFTLAIAANLRLFTSTELMALICGQQHVTAAELVSRVVFERYPAGCPTPGMLACASVWWGIAHPHAATRDRLVS